MAVKEDYRWIDGVVSAMTRQADLGTWNGKMPTPYFASCKTVMPFRGMQLIYSRDTGYHTSGWWKNPDYERCYHLSLSFFDVVTRQVAPRDRKLTAKLVDAFFGRNKRLLWVEPPYSAHGKRTGVWHYRLFCDAGWQPIKPRGEVYSRELTEAGWKSYSDAMNDAGKTHQSRSR